MPCGDATPVPRPFSLSFYLFLVPSFWPCLMGPVAMVEQAASSRCFIYTASGPSPWTQTKRSSEYHLLEKGPSERIAPALLDFSRLIRGHGWYSKQHGRLSIVSLKNSVQVNGCLFKKIKRQTWTLTQLTILHYNSKFLWFPVYEKRPDEILLFPSAIYLRIPDLKGTTEGADFSIREENYSNY